MSGQPANLSDLPTRVAVGVLLIALAIVDVLIGGWPFRLLVLAGAGIMLFEWADMHKVPRHWAWAGAVLLAILLLGAAEWLYPADEMDEAISAATFQPAWTGWAAALAGGVLLALLSRRIAMGWGFVYVAVPAFAVLVLSWAYYGLVLWVMIVTWATDIFAYFAGRAIGGPKLAPRISPNKTWAGLAGGGVGAAVLGGLAAWWLDLGSPFLALGGLMAVVAQAGDLYESWVKRRAGVKDSGTILPGHGGVLDRLDGLLPVAVLTLLLLMAGLWTG
jgi:phosphatidate cytidylyltransferase